MNPKRLLTIGIATLWLAALGDFAMSAHDKHTVKVPGGLRSLSSGATKDGRSAALLAKHPHLRSVSVFAVDIDSEIFEMIDQFLEILWLDLRQRQRNSMAGERAIELVVRLLRNECRKPDSRPEKLHRHAHVDCGQALVPGHGLVGLNQHTQELRARLWPCVPCAVCAGRCLCACANSWLRIKRRKQPLGLVSSDSSGGEHIQNLLPVLVHSHPPIRVSGIRSVMAPAIGESALRAASTSAGPAR